MGGGLLGRSFSVTFRVEGAAAELSIVRTEPFLTPFSQSGCEQLFAEKSRRMLHRHVMSHYMARGESGRIVLEIDPSDKGELYTALTKDGMTLKDWFLRQASQYLRDRNQPALFGTLADSATPATLPPGPKPKGPVSYRKKRKTRKNS